MLPPLFVFTGFTGIETGWRCGDVWKMRRKRKLKLSGLYSKTVQLGGVKAPTQTEEQMDFLCARGGYPFDRFFLVCHSCPDVEYQISSNKNDHEIPSRAQFKEKQSCFRSHHSI